jgi:signal transduction histidine kinase
MKLLFDSIRRRRDRAAQRLGRLIERQHAEIERRWLDRVSADLGGEPEAGLSELRDGMPDYLHALADALRRGGSDTATHLQRAWSDVARAHGVTRVRLGFDISQLVHEFVVLRATIREVAREHGIRAWSPDAVLTDALDAAISQSVQAYVEARNYEVRRQQAETIAFLTHELRNPLAAAVLAAAQLRKSASAAQAPTVDALDRYHQRLSAMIDSVLLNEKLEAGKFQSHPSEVRIAELIEPAIEAARMTAQRKRVAFNASYDRELRVRVDPALTRSVIENLADNAAKYTDAGSIDLLVEDRADAIVIHMRDTCHGLSPEELRTIFEPFRRGRTRQSGTGLGLAIARRAIEAQGGSIHAESPEPTGCHFWVELPKHVRADAAPPDPAHQK